MADWTEGSSRRPTGYSIRVAGHLAEEWADWFAGLTIRCHPDGTTTLSGPISDQAALHGVLLKVRDLGLTLIAVNLVEPTPATHGPTENVARDEKESEESRKEPD